MCVSIGPVVTLASTDPMLTYLQAVLYTGVLEILPTKPKFSLETGMEIAPRSYIGIFKFYNRPCTYERMA